MTMERLESGSRPTDNWAAGEAYEPYVGRWSRLVAEEFLQWLAVPPGGLWLDVGCGTGALVRAILDAAAPQAVKGIDAAQSYIEFAREQIRDSRASFQLGDAQSLPVETDSSDAVVSGLLLNFIPDTGRAVAEMARAAKPGGLVAAYVWDYAGRMQFMRHFWNAAAALDPKAADLDEGRRFPLCVPGPLADLFQSAGLTGVEIRPIDIWTTFKDFDDYWSPFLGGQGPAPTYVMTINEEDRTRLRELIRAGLPFALDGSIPLMARAWAVRGVR
jgi:SAM-dependent methyltransferase